MTNPATFIVKETTYRQFPGGQAIIECEPVDGCVLPEGFPRFKSGASFSNQMTKYGPVDLNVQFNIDAETLDDAFECLPHEMEDARQKAVKRAEKQIAAQAAKHQSQVITPDMIRRAGNNGHW